MRLTSRSPGFMTQGILKAPAVLCFGLLVFHVEAASARAADVWTIESGDIDPVHYAGISVANGMIGLLSAPHPFGTRQTLVAGAYEPDPVRRISIILQGFDFLKLVFSVDGDVVSRIDQVRDFHETFDMKRAVLTTTFRYQDKVTVRSTVRALRQLPFDAMIEVTVSAQRPVTISVESLMEASPMLKGVSILQTPTGEGGTPMLAASAQGISGVLKVGAAQSFLFDMAAGAAPSVVREGTNESQGLAFTKALPGGASYHFALVGAMTTSSHTVDPVTTAERLTIFAVAQGTAGLIAAHEREWADLWKGDIRIEGDDIAQRDVRSMLYHLYSFAREGTGNSIAPMGLSSAGYAGHIFWDAELWMFPALLALHPEMAKSILDYRFARLPAARRNALAHGYRGAMFPWEGADSGDEDTPIGAMSGPLEHHITADVAIAAWNYYRVTQDRRWLAETGFPLIRDTADFWTSRVERHGAGHYDIDHVVAADEYANNVDNDAFTNAAARENLAAAIAASRILGLMPNPDWEDVRENIPILKFPDGTTREHAGYHGEEIKQADVNLLGFPLKAITDPGAIRRDLDYYGSRVAADGPAMTKSILAILYQRLGMPDQALEWFKAGFKPNQRAPFGVLSESPRGDNPYFATGAGGSLQTVIYGFGGLDITDGGLTQIATRLPRGWKSLTIAGVGPDHRTYTVK